MENDNQYGYDGPDSSQEPNPAMEENQAALNENEGAWKDPQTGYRQSDDPQTGYQQSNYQQTEYQQTGDQQPQYQSYTRPQKQSNMALASLIMGIIGIVTSCCCYGGFIFGSLGILFALLSKTGERFEGYALAGVITSIIALVLTVAVTLLLIGSAALSSFMPGGVY